MTVQDATGALYAGHPADFVARRDELVRAARADGDRELATQIAALRKPTVGAWLANLLQREHRDQLEQLVELGAALREAQDVLDPEQLRALGQQRYRVVSALVVLARRTAADLGRPASAAAAEELESTLTAALADPDAAAALLSGRLTHGLAYAGLGFDDSSPPPGSADRAAPAPRAVHAAEPPVEARDAAQAAARAARIDTAERDLAQARLQAAAAASEAADAQRRHDVAQHTSAQAAERVERLGRELAGAEADLRSAKAELGAAAQEQAATGRAAAAALRRAERAGRSLDALRSR